MNDQKIENLLNLALDATKEEREKSLELSVGFDREDRSWEVIVRYHGDILWLRDEGIGVELLLMNYAILTVPESRIDAVAQLEVIEYIEKPKRLFFSVNQGKTASCIPRAKAPAADGGLGLSGEGVLVAVIDSGIDYFHGDFCNEDSTTRILALWDQTMAADPERGFFPPEGYDTGVLFDRDQIDLALKQPDRAQAYQIVPSRDLSGHGTAVAGIAAGNGRESEGGRYAGVADKSPLLIVKLGNPDPDSFPRTTQLMRGINFAIEKSLEYGMPVAINLSFGNTYGSHRGNSLLESFINDASGVGRNVLCIGAGNEGAAGGHTGGILTGRRDVSLAVSPYESALSIQLWKNYADEFEIKLISPSGKSVPIRKGIVPQQRERLGNTELLIYYGEPIPYSVEQEIYIDLLPVNQYIDSGIWTLRLTPVKVVSGQYNLYLPSENVLQSGTRFLLPEPGLSFTIPSTAAKGISVGGYNSYYDSYADFSGRGYVTAWNQAKPDLAAPAVDIRSAKARGGYESFTGTSFATPFVTGASALMMEWGIVRGNDRFLFGEKVKAYLQRGARPISGIEDYPNPLVGYGALCLMDSLPL